jgi:hypothetical protein
MHIALKMQVLWDVTWCHWAVSPVVQRIMVPSFSGSRHSVLLDCQTLWWSTTVLQKAANYRASNTASHPSDIPVTTSTSNAALPQLDHNTVPHHVMLISLWHQERIQIIAVHDINIVMPVRNVSNSNPINAMAIPNPVCNLQHNSETRKMIKVYTQHKTSVVQNMLLSSYSQIYKC